MLVVFLAFAIASGGLEASGQVLVDSLNGGSVGDVHGGEFVSGGGWTPVEWDDMIIFDTHVYIIRGTLEITVRNFDPEIQNSSQRHHILAMYTDEIGDHNHWSYLRSDSTGKAVWNLHTGTFYDGGIKFLSHAGDLIQTYREYLQWDVDSTYKFTVKWDANRVRFFINDTLVVENINQSNFVLRYVFLGRDYTTSLDLQTGYPDNQYPAQLGPIYSNLVVYADSVLEPVYPSQNVGYDLFVPSDRDVFAFEFFLKYPGHLLEFSGLEKQNNDDLFVEYGDSLDEVRVAGFSPYPIPSDSPAVRVQFQPKPDPSQTFVAHLTLDSLYYDEELQESKILSYVIYPQDSSTSVPVELLSFQVIGPVAGEVVLRWTAASESNCYGYLIERSRDGTSFVPIGLVRARGEKNVSQEYVFRDTTAVEGELFYRLSEVGPQGEKKCLAIGGVWVGSPQEFRLLPVSPNPLSTSAYLSFNAPRALVGSRVELDLFDVMGRLVWKRSVPVSEAGLHRVLWNGNGLDGSMVPSGVYVLVAKSLDGRVFSQKILVER